MISSFQYLSPIAEAYSRINEAFPKDVYKLLITKYAPVYKEDGYDQFGVDRNGKRRGGKPAIWRFPDRWFGDVKRLETLLASAKAMEARRNGTSKHHYNRFGFDTLGYDKQGFDINDKDILGVDGSEYGNDDYNSEERQQQRKIGRRNLFSKISMRDINYEKRNGAVDPTLEKKILDAYKRYSQYENPKREFENYLRMLFLRRGRDGKLVVDNTSVRYFMQKYPFDEVNDGELKNISNVEYLDKVITAFHTQLKQTFRPNNPDDFLDIKTSTETKGDELVARVEVSLKDKEDSTSLQNASYAAKRLNIIFQDTGFYSYIIQKSRGFIIMISILPYHKSTVNTRRADNAYDDYEYRNQLGVYDPKLKQKLNAHKKK